MRLICNFIPNFSDEDRNPPAMQQYLLCKSGCARKNSAIFAALYFLGSGKI
jgi:hypothetical protein